MKIGVLAEAQTGETRVSATPATVAELRKLGYDVVVQSGAGALASYSDEAYAAAGAEIGDPLAADIVFGVNAPSSEQLDALRPGATVVSLMTLAVDRSRPWPWTPYRVSRAHSHWTF